MRPTSNEAAALRRPSFLDQRSLRLLLFGGKGGVGKTTCASATALRLAEERPSERFLLVSTDPAHSVQDSLAGMLPPANLTVLELDAKQCLEKFLSENGDKLHAIAAAGTFLDDEDISRFLSLSLPGLDELMAFLEIVGWVESRTYATIVVDTAPSGHTLRLLAMPGLIRKWLSMLDALLAKRRYMRKVFSHSSSPDELDAFLTRWRTSIRSMEALLRDRKRCEFVPVSLAEPLSVTETVALRDELQHWRIPVENLILNQLHPRGSGCVTCSNAYAREREQIRRLYDAGRPVALWGVERNGRGDSGRSAVDAFLGSCGPSGTGAGRGAGRRPGTGWARDRALAAGRDTRPGALARNPVGALHRKGRRGQNHSLLRHRPASGARLPREADSAVFHRPGALALCLPQPAKSAPGLLPSWAD